MGIWLVMKTTALEERPFQLRKERTVIGRALTTDVRVPIPGVAPRHCEITLEGDRVRLSDLGTEPGVLHNGERVEEAWLTHEDEVTVGSVTFTIRMSDLL
jgi:pSer/pThr/pTyr-binding forkhead associated (FHA) protein